MPHIAYLVVQQNISSCCRADISRSLGFQPLPTSFGAVRSAPKRSLADSSDESVPTEIHRSVRREPVVVHARRSPSNGRRGVAGAVVGFGTRGSGRLQSPPPFVVDVPAVHHLHQCQDSSGINQGHQPTARAAFTNGKPRFQKLLEPLDLQLITPEIKRRNRLACLKPRPEI